MKSKFTAILSFVLLLAPLSLYAASKNSQNVRFPEAVTVGGTQIPAGTYKLQWDATGNVTINQGKKVVASVPATVTQTPSPYDGALQTEGKVLRGIEFKNVTIKFEASNASAASGN